MESSNFLIYMQNNPQLVKYIGTRSDVEFSSIERKREFLNEKKNVISETIDALKYIEGKFLSLRHNSSVSILKKPHFIPKSVYKTFMQIRFLEKYINDYKEEIDEFDNQCIKKTLEIFHSKEINSETFVVVCNIEKFLETYKIMKYHLNAAKAKLNHLKIYFKEKTNIKISHNSQIECLQNLLTAIHPLFDPSLAFFCPCPFQDQYEALFFHPDFLFAEDVAKIVSTFSVTSPSDFLQEIVHLVEKICNKIERTNTHSLSIFIGLCFRALFDCVYPEVKLFSLPELSFDLIGTLKDLKISDISPPKECCPPGMRDGQIIADVFKNDPNFSLAVEQVEFISFFTNPLDILHHVFHSLREIEKSANVYGNGPTTMLSFDVTFGLFLCILLSADIPELMRIAMFTDQYTPSRGLCPDFEFALAKLSTASIHLQNRAQSKLNCV